jgi:NAD(P)-dependent dehydrogenase (short-subunit alcohol dehydrogenase family)
MGIFEQLREQNLTHDLAGKNVLITGGTHGIGAAGYPLFPFTILTVVAYHFAELGANVTIAGRNAREAETILERLRSVAPSKEAEFEFVQMDASLNSNTVAFADKMCEKYKTGLYCLCMCQGGIANGSPRKETSEGHEWYVQ